MSAFTDKQICTHTDQEQQLVDHIKICYVGESNSQHDLWFPFESFAIYKMYFIFKKYKITQYEIGKSNRKDLF